MTVDDLQKQSKITRQDISDLLTSIGKPGEKQNEKLQVLQDLGKKNRQGYDLSVTAETYQEF